MNQIELKNISKNYGPATVLADASLAINSGELGCIIGPNGCGKSTLVKIAAGILKQSSGEVKITGRLSYLPQQPSLLPWKTVEDNLLLASYFKSNINPMHAQKLLKKFGLHKFSKHYPHQLSGGMQQKLAILRSLAISPDVLLLDEPFNSLDAITKLQMHGWMQTVLSEFKPAVMWVTHDISEAIFLADKIFVMSPRPGSIKKVFEVKLPRPRQLEQSASSQSLALEKKLMRMLEI